MYIFLTALLAGTALPQIDRASLELQARAEALQPTSSAARTVRRAAARPAANFRRLDLDAITTICRAAGGQKDPSAFLERLSSAYGMPAGDSAALRSSCAAYLAGLADARGTGGTTY